MKPKRPRGATLSAAINALLLSALCVSCSRKEAPQAKPRPAEAKAESAATASPVLVNPSFQSSIRSILQDSNGHYWFGSDKEGVARFDGESFVYWSTEDGLPSNQVRSIQEGADGTIWFGTAEGVGSYSGATLVNHTQGFGASPGETHPGEWASSDNDLWFGAGHNEGVYRYDGESVRYLSFPASPPTAGGQSRATTGIAAGKSGKTWIATYSAVFGYDRSGLTTIDDEAAGFAGRIGGLHVRSILEDSEGRLWIGNNGVGVLVADGGAIRHFSEEMGLVPQMSQRSGGPSPQGTLEHVFAIEEDRLGNLWFGDRDTGAWRYDGASMTNFVQEHGLPSLSIWDIHQAAGGELLFGLDNGSVCRFTGTRFETLPRANPPPPPGERAPHLDP